MTGEEGVGRQHGHERLAAPEPGGARRGGGSGQALTSVRRRGRRAEAGASASVS